MANESPERNVSREQSELEAALKALHDAACDVPVMRATAHQRELVARCSAAIDVARGVLGYPKPLSTAEVKAMMKESAPESAILNQRGRRRAARIRKRP